MSDTPKTNHVTLDIADYQKLVQSEADLKVKVSTLSSEVDQLKDVRTKLTEVETEFAQSKVQLEELTNNTKAVTENYAQLFDKYRQSLGLEEKIKQLTDDEKALISSFAEDLGDWENPSTPTKAEAIAKLVEKTISGRDSLNPTSKKAAEGKEGNPNATPGASGFNHEKVVNK